MPSKTTSPATGAPIDAPGAAPALALEHAMVVMQPLVRWLLRSGVGFGATTDALKAVFLQEAARELERRGQKASGSGLSVMSGLHRKDVRLLLEQGAPQAMASRSAQADARVKPSAASRLVTQWLAQRWPRRLPISNPQPGAAEPTPRSFERLARQVSTDVHPRALLTELERLGLVVVDDTTVQLQKSAFVPDSQQTAAAQCMSSHVADHLSAAVHNLQSENTEHKFLERSVFADGLSAESVTVLHDEALRLWEQVFSVMVALATPLCEQDAQATPPQRFRIGMYCYSTRANTPNPPVSNDTGTLQEVTP
ncbi:MAG: hypothetical protein IPH37_12955 [Burkholderiales bacterium]|nr:hypothetical protein [Burkholderiales bacterium]